MRRRESGGGIERVTSEGTGRDVATRSKAGGGVGDGEGWDGSGAEGRGLNVKVVSLPMAKVCLGGGGPALQSIPHRRCLTSLR